ncbi:hypothetical protein ALC62_02420 [Cyphomyrmex costatus]|uniref:MADF domain-containing protein n=1 Tax=Cyphomyrmex costatus TaxID=456900 RepID=A0A151IN30_9HYME|nr:hypothetical protein ALC62_02420 [Cyphomyrmex costatus]
MSDHNDYFTYADESQNESQILISSKEDEDALLIDLVKGYPHLYNKESRDFKDTIKKNNSWEEIAKILDAKDFANKKYISFVYRLSRLIIFLLLVSDCQTRLLRLHERYSREKKLREIDTRSGSGNVTRQTFPLYDQMNFLYKFVKSRK